MNMPVLTKSQDDCIWPAALDRWLKDQKKSYDDLAADIVVDKSRVRRWKQAGHIPWGQVRLLALYTGLSPDLFFPSGASSPMQSALSGLVDLTRQALIFDEIPPAPVYPDINDAMSFGEGLPETPNLSAPKPAAESTDGEGDSIQQKCGSKSQDQGIFETTVGMPSDSGVDVVPSATGAQTEERKQMKR